MNIILGGGLIALIARDILGDDWKIIPMGKSLYYSFNPPLADNYVIKDDAIDNYMDQFTLIPVYTKLAFSIAGQLTHNPAIALDPWLQKVYGPEIPPQTPGYWRRHLEYFSYGDCADINARLQQRYMGELVSGEEKFGKATAISDHRITTTKTVLEYDNIISTIPLPALMKMLGYGVNLPSKDLYCYHLRTDWDFEGSSHILVADREIEFYKVTKINQVNFVFYANKQIMQPGRYFMGFLKKFDLIGEVHLPEATPCGPIPDFQHVKDANILPVGSNAAWDDCLDVGSCIKRLLKYGR